ncbi:MAG TPA: mechanosensitive ion channel [Candidatus Altiarchaeales archaeon]|nr:mechanosensitive ion channel [Candidatus Altiarchaeales archaeon]
MRSTPSPIETRLIILSTGAKGISAILLHLDLKTFIFLHRNNFNMDSMEAFNSSLINESSGLEVKFLGFSLPEIYVDVGIAICIILASIILAKLLYIFVERYMKRLAKRTKSDIDDKILEIVHKPIYYIIILLGLQLAISHVLISLNFEHLVSPVTGLVKAIAIALVVWILTKVSDILLYNFGDKIVSKTKSEIDKEALPFISNVVKILLYAVGVMIILDQLGIDISPLTVGAGVAGFAIGFAAQDTLSNIIAGFFILIDKPFKVGDRIQVGEHLGDIVEITLRTTRIKTLENNYVIIPNSELITREVINYKLPKANIRVFLNIGVAYGSDPEKVKEIVMETMKKCEYILDKPEPKVFFVEFGESSLNFKLVFWVGSYTEKLKALDFLHTTLYKRFAEEGIEIPFPCRTVYLREEK